MGHRREDEGGGDEAVHDVRPQLASLRQGPAMNISYHTYEVIALVPLPDDGGGRSTENKHPEPVNVLRLFNSPQTNVPTKAQISIFYNTRVRGPILAQKKAKM